MALGEIGSMVGSGLDGKVVLVTGSSRGIGAAIARLFAQHGAKVAVHGRDTAAVAAVRSDIESAGGTVTQVVADVTKFAEIEAMRRQVEHELGPIDVFVANAGGSFTIPGLPSRTLLPKPVLKSSLRISPRRAGPTASG